MGRPEPHSHSKSYRKDPIEAFRNNLLEIQSFHCTDARQTWFCTSLMQISLLLRHLFFQHLYSGQMGIRHRKMAEIDTRSAHT
ncbi:uncharacterized protein M6B38_319695 [Iris pallida]|uniref:Uncharacterized protein n=1 Tax=Iris pallida TaxID=29817 RepID=A0AAX6HC26_IRIPA|nr:uncharacterized protein M6B38_319695 [Iris pallida]